MKKYIIILLVFYLNSISALYAENSKQGKIDLKTAYAISSSAS